MSVLFINGFNDDSTAKMYPDADGGVSYQYDGCCGVYGYMDFGKNRVNSLTLFGDTFKHQKIRIPKKTSLVFNEISDPDSHHSTLKRCEELCWKLQLPVINHPTHILATTRDNTPIMLKDIPGLVVPATISITPASPEDVFTAIEEQGLALPVIVRAAGTHGGITSLLIRGREDYDKLHVYAFDGTKYYLTEFVDFASPDGLYRKNRIVVIDGVPVIRHHLVDKQWMIHGHSRHFMTENKLLDEEAEMLRETFDKQILPVIRPVIDEITRRLQLEYYGIDCNIDEQGKMLIFEVNANMNVLSNKFRLYDGQLSKIRQQILQLIKKFANSQAQQAS